MIDRILTSIIPTFWPEPRVYIRRGYGYLFWLERRVCSASTSAAEKHDYIEVAQPYNEGMATVIYDAFGHKRAVSALWLDCCGVALAIEDVLEQSR